MADRVSIVEQQGLGLAIVQARKGVTPASIGRSLGLDLPVGPGGVRARGLSAIGTGPGNWFVIAEGADDGWAERLTASLDGQAAVFDQSSGYVVLRVSGPGARRALQAGAPIDLDPAQFGANSAASTSIGHIVVLLWRSDDENSYDVAFYRSYRDSLEHWLAHSMAAAQGSTRE